MDDTYKVIHEGYSVTVMGQSDADRVFHVRAVGVSTNSDERVGRFYLNAWKARVPEFSPRAYLGDAAQAYANAAMAIYPSIDIRLMCFAHVYKVHSTGQREMSFLFFETLLFCHLIKLKITILLILSFETEHGETGQKNPR